MQLLKATLPPSATSLRAYALAYILRSCKHSHPGRCPLCVHQRHLSLRSWGPRIQISA
eukprot:SAG31_NODE_11699_length_1005_cov_1.590508_1_plen_57_part_10